MRAFIIVLIIFVSSSLYSQSYRLYNNEVTRNEYIEALPYVNSDHLRVRDLPTLNNSNIITKINNGTGLIIRAVTSDDYLIGGELFPWYEVEIFENQEIKGWIYGKYLSFNEDYLLDYWVDYHYVPNYPIALFEGSAIQRQAIKLLFSLEDYEITKEEIGQLEFIEEHEVSIWHLKDFTWQKYRTSFGYIWILFKEEDDSYRISSLVVNNTPNDSFPINIGDSRSKIENYFNNNFYEKDNKIIIFNPDVQSRSLSYEMKENKVISITIATEWAAF